MSDGAEINERIILKLATTGEGYGERVKQTARALAAAGMSEAAILLRLKKECSPGGTLYESIMAGFRNVTGEVVDYVSVEEAHSTWGGRDAWIWISVEDANRCEDCAERDGEVKTWAEWEELGLPGMGTTVCDWRCRCSLEPADLAAEVTL